MTSPEEDVRRTGIPVAAVAVAAFGLLVGGALLIETGSRGGVTGGVLLAIGGLALAAVALGGDAYGPAVEGRLELSTRLALGLFGGLLGTAVALGAAWVLARLGIPGLLGVELPGPQATGGLAIRMSRGALWGLVFGVLLPWVPGRGTLARGASFSLLPGLHALLVVFPAELEAGWFGVELGALVFIFVLLLYALWGIVAGWVMSWGERSDLAPLSAPLDE